MISMMNCSILRCCSQIMFRPKPYHITRFDLAVDPPALWDEQRERVGL